MDGVQTRLYGPTLVVRIPMRFQRRGGWKRIVAPDGSAIVPTNKPQPDGTLVKALARAWRWQRMLDDGAYASVSDIGDAEDISKSYVSRLLRLELLAPDIVEAILAGTMDQVMMLEGAARPTLLVNQQESRPSNGRPRTPRSDLNSAHEPGIGSVDTARLSDASSRRPGALHFPS